MTETYALIYRASIEPNFHDLYLKFFDKVNSKSLNKEIMKATYENCKVIFTHFSFPLMFPFFFNLDQLENSKFGFPRSYYSRIL